MNRKTHVSTYKHITPDLPNEIILLIKESGKMICGYGLYY